jgi:bifunctional oligoribonuclease and PAP phosphatase NrnA
MNTDMVTLIGFEECERMLREAASVVLTTHTNPDGDAIGSEYALYHALRDRGKDVRIINCDSAPENLAFLDSATVEIYEPSDHDAFIAAADLLVALDLNDIRRIRHMEQVFRAAPGRKLVIDHHLDPKPFADAYCTMPEASSTAEIVHDLLEREGVSLSYPVAVGLYVGIVTDTGSFRFDRTTPRVHRIAARLLEAGVDPTAIYQLIYDDYPMRRSQLMGMILAGVEEHCGGRVTLLTVTAEMFSATGTSVEDVENMVNLGMGIRGVEATAMFTVLDGHIKVSFRSRGRISVNDIAGRFGGGGHRLAAGATVEDITLEQLKEEVAAALCAAVSAESAQS